MERGVYFDAWFPRQHCYHPSLPPRRLRMVDDLRDYRATCSSGPPSAAARSPLPYLEEEAFGEIDPRFRFYGFVNDAEFIAECQKHGIKVFGIVFEVQGWEFPAELNEDEDRVLALNEPRGVGKRGWLGLREFSPEPLPQALAARSSSISRTASSTATASASPTSSRSAARATSTASPCHAHWVECPDREHFCYMMDRNNPVWREYLKAIIRIQIDAGVDGVQLDEAELPFTTLQYGGCFCKDCMKGFRAYLQALPADDLPGRPRGADLSDLPLRRVAARAGLRLQDRTARTRRSSAHYLRFQRRPITRYFGELADYAREYAASKGRDRARLGQLLQPVRPVLPARAQGRPDHHRDAQHPLPPTRLVPLRGRVRRAASRSWWSRTPTAASCPSWSPS